VDEAEDGGSEPDCDVLGDETVRWRMSLLPVVEDDEVDESGVLADDDALVAGLVEALVEAVDT
jgi:hypothetical protein